MSYITDTYNSKYYAIPIISVFLRLGLGGDALVSWFPLRWAIQPLT